MGSNTQTERLDAFAPLVEQYEFECLLSARNAEQDRAAAPAALLSEVNLCVHFSAETDPDSQAAAAHNTFQDPAASLRKPEALPTFYSASHAVSNLAPSSSALRAPERIRDAPVRERIGFLAGLNLSDDQAHAYNDKERLQAQKLGRPRSSTGAVLQAGSWFDDVAGPRMQQMYNVQKDVVREHGLTLDQQIQDLTAALSQDMQSLQSIGTDVPARLAVDRVQLYIAEVMPLISTHRGHVLEVQTQYTDGLEDFVKSVFVRGIEEAIAARDVWHHDKIVAMRLQHEQILQNLRSSNMVEIRRALHNQSVDLIRQHQTQAEYAANGQAIAARDKALEELQELQVLHSELQIKSAAQAESIEEMVPELEALRKLLRNLQGVEAKYEAAQKELAESKHSLAETAEALQEWQAAEQQHKALFGPLANLDPTAMASKLDETLAELKLIRERQEQVLEQQEKIRVNAEKAQLQKEMQEQKARVRQKALADKALQKYSGKPAYQAELKQQDPPASSAAMTAVAAVSNSSIAVSPSPAANASVTTGSHQSPAVQPTDDAEMVSEPFFSNSRSRALGERPAMRRGGIRGATQSPIPARQVSRVTSQQSLSNFGQTMTRAAAARSASPVFSPGKIQNALQRTLAQLPHD